MTDVLWVRTVRWPLEPLREATGLATVGQLERAAGVPAGTGRRWERIGLTDTMADRVAIAVAEHPALVWERWYDVL